MRLISVVNNPFIDEAERQTALRLLQNMRQIPELSIEKMALLCFVSPASLSRFCKRLGFKNYAYFRSLFEMFLDEEEMFKPTYRAQLSADPLNKTFARVVDYHIQAMEALKKQIDFDTVTQAVDAINLCEHAYLICDEDLIASVMDFQLQMAKFNKFIEVLSGWLPSNKAKGNSVRILPNLKHIEGPLDLRKIEMKTVERLGREKGNLKDIHISIIETSPYVSNLNDRFINEGKIGKQILSCILEVFYVLYYERHVNSFVEA